jgi:hypothetical protein
MQNDAFARAQNDGYTLGIMTVGQIIAAVMNKSLSWRSEQDLAQPMSDGAEKVMTPFLSVMHSGARIRWALMRATLVRQRGAFGEDHPKANLSVVRQLALVRLSVKKRDFCDPHHIAGEKAKARYRQKGGAEIPARADRERLPWLRNPARYLALRRKGLARLG